MGCKEFGRLGCAKLQQMLIDKSPNPSLDYIALERSIDFRVIGVPASSTIIRCKVCDSLIDSPTQSDTYLFAIIVVYAVQGFGSGTGPILLDDVACSGNEIRLQDCSHRPIGMDNCDHTEDAGVVCMSLGILYTCSIDHAVLLLSLKDDLTFQLRPSYVMKKVKVLLANSNFSVV